MITEKVLTLFLKNQIITKEEKDIYRFGLECLILKVINYAAFIYIGIVLGMTFELFFLALAFIPLRRSAGGFHADTPLGCFFFSCSLEILVLNIIKLNIPVVGVFLIVLIMEGIILMLAPIDNENKRMDEEEKTHYRKKNKQYITLITIIALILVIVKNQRILNSIAGGVLLAMILLVIGYFQEKQKREENS